MKTVTKKLALGVACAALAASPLLWPESAQASPGQCITSPWGGYCDSLPITRDGVFQHCEGALGFQNCFLVRPVPVEVDPRGWLPI